MARYLIQKWTPKGWRKAWGWDDRTYISAATDAEALSVFRRETAGVKKIPHRLMKGDPSLVVLETLSAAELLARREKAELEKLVKPGRPGPGRRDP